MLADKRRITQVVSNLLNAIKFIGHEAGSIQIVTEMNSVDVHFSNSHVVIAIMDMDKGIDSEIMPRLFSKFSTNSEYGAGLGPYISKSIVEAHGGNIWAKNNEDGRGACFCFTLPIAAQIQHQVHLQLLLFLESEETKYSAFYVLQENVITAFKEAPRGILSASIVYPDQLEQASQQCESEYLFILM